MLFMNPAIPVCFLLLRFTLVVAHSGSLGRPGPNSNYWPPDDSHHTLNGDDRPLQESFPHDRIHHREASSYILVKRALTTNLEVYMRVRKILHSIKELETHPGTRQDTLDLVASLVEHNSNDQRLPLNGQFWRLIASFQSMREREEKEVRELLDQERSAIYRKAAVRFQKMADDVFWEQWHREVHGPSKHSSAKSTDMDKSTTRSQLLKPGGPNRDIHSHGTNVKGSMLPPMGPVTRQWKHPDSTWAIVAPKTQKSQSKHSEP